LAQALALVGLGLELVPAQELGPVLGLELGLHTQLPSQPSTSLPPNHI